MRKEQELSRRTFIRGTIGVAGAALTTARPVLGAGRDAADAEVAKGLSKPPAGCSENRLEKASKYYEPRYPGPRWHIIYGSYDGIEQFALNELQRMVQCYFPYVVEVHHVTEAIDTDAHHILIGTLADNPRLAELGRKGAFKIPAKPQSYSSACFKSPWNGERKLVTIIGADAEGVSYGVIDFNKRMAAITPDDPREIRKTVDQLAEFQVTDAPVIENRGIWSWGYVIYDYKRFIDNMARLKMNRLNFWNDVPPINCQQVIDYAHSRGIKVVLGFSWGYALSTLDPTSAADRQVVKENVLCQIAEYYAHLGVDAIYFQNFTETSTKKLGAKSLAAVARDWVNDIGGAVLQRYPQMKLEWGLHASSIVENYKDLETLDPRISIVWEDAGVIPYSYEPVTTDPDLPAIFNTPAATRKYSRELATFRDHSPFAMVAKGWIQARWRTETEHHGQYILGERAASFIRNRTAERQARWDFVNRLWLENYPEALRFFSEVRQATSAPMTVLGLIEDGLFEEKIQSSAALFAEMIWNPERDAKDTLEWGLNPYYSEIG
jgi:hypothetical protein